MPQASEASCGLLIATNRTHHENGGQLSRVNSISFTKGTTSLGNLTYQRDPRGRIVSVGGNLARVSLPDALSSSVYDDANEMTQFGASSWTRGILSPP